MSLAGKTLFITGASRGIGLAIGLRAARDGANIAIAAKTVEPHPKLAGTIYTAANEIEHAGGKALPLAVDVRDETSVKTAIERTAEKFGGIDIVVNNASAIQLTGVADTDMKRFDLMHQVNARGSFVVSKWAIRYLENAANRHILMLSPPLDMKEKWFAPHTAYSMAKFGMSMVVLGLAGELRPKGIAVNALWPRTIIATAAIQNLLGGDARMRQTRKPDIVADAAHAIFCSPSRDLTGRFLIDDSFLAERGVTDFERYRLDPAHQLAQDFFLPDDIAAPPGRAHDRELWRPQLTYRAPLADIGFALKYGAGLNAAIEEGLFGDLAVDDVDAVLAEAGRIAGEVLAPLNRIGDSFGTPFKNGAVTTPPGWKEAYLAWRTGGWNGLAAPTEWGGQALPQALNLACIEMWNAAAMAFALGPLLTIAAVDALSAHGSATLKRCYLEKLVSGEWMGTMQLTEPQAGSDVGALRTRAERAGDGSYRLTGQKIFITYGEHDLTDNIIHFVLARLPDAPPGTRGISLFLVPKFLLQADGSPGARNDVRAHSVEHKLGIHGSPTCTMIFGDQGGATGFLIGEENAGMACMFTMMNRARLAVGVQGVGLADRATQQALAYARERRQGRTAAMKATESAVIASFPDVKRMLLTMRALTQAARVVCYSAALALDRAERGTNAAARAAAHDRVSLLTPVAKAFSTDIANEVASLGVQVHGGMGYVEETGAAQLYRDARISAIYEGTNGIQAIDLVTRKLPLAGGHAIAAHLEELRGIVAEVEASNDPALGWTPVRLAEATESLARATDWMLGGLAKDPDGALAGATPYLRLFGLATGGCLLAHQALAAQRLGDQGAARVALARFFAENFAIQAGALERIVVEGSPGLLGADSALA